MAKSRSKPAANLAGYSGTPLVKKLGIREGAKVVLVGAPAGFETWIADLPAGAKVARRLAGKPGMILWFVRSKSELRSGARKMAGAFAGKSGLWIAWPKRTSKLAADFSEDDVRAVGLAAGLVDFKICAIDATWSGLRFARRSEPARA